MQKNKNLIPLIVLCIVLLMVLPVLAVGDIQNNQAQTSIPSPTLADMIPLFTAEPIMLGQGPDEYLPNVNPLTGEIFDNPDILNRRPVAVKITNFPRYTRPQRGLMSADIVYHYYTEMGKTRFVGVFYGQDAEMVGPIRSGRFFDEHIVRMYDALLVFGRADARVLAYFYAMEPYFQDSLILESVYDAENDCFDGRFLVFCRDREKVWYNSLHVNTKALTADMDRRNLENHKAALSGMYFTDEPIPGNIAFKITVTYSGASSVVWDYHTDEEKYYRKQEMDVFDWDALTFTYEQLYDDLTDEPVTADNIVVLFVEYEFFAKQPEAESMIINLYGEGTGYAYRNGMAVPVRWKRAEDASMLRIEMLDGSPYPFKVGNTFFEIINTNSEMSVADGIHWNYLFHLPFTDGEDIRPESRATATASVTPTAASTAKP